MTKDGLTSYRDGQPMLTNRDVSAYADAVAGDRERIAEHLRAAAALKQEAERQELFYVEKALKAGFSWSEIAGCLGVTKQSAHRKYSKRMPKPMRSGQ